MRSSLALCRAGLVREGGVWAKRCKVTPITDRSHQINVARYIAQHADRGGVLWAVWELPPGVGRMM